MWKLALVSCLVACVDSADDTPLCEGKSIQFGYRGEPIDEIQLAVGGTIKLSMECVLPDVPEQAPWDLPAIAMPLDQGVTAEIDGPWITLHGDSANELEVVVGESPQVGYGDFAVHVRDVDHISFGDNYDQVPDGYPTAFAKEAGHSISVSPVASDGTYLLDESLTVTPPPDARMIGSGTFDISTMAIGDASMSVTAGAKTFDLPFSIVDHADAMTEIESRYPYLFCYAATNNGRFVEGLNWTWIIDGVQTPAANCVAIGRDEDVDHDGLITTSASAGGITTNLVIPAS